ncbi:DUF3500 domain-containing protein [Hymenobacter sp. GOD-10R]|uniref:DUF3500 domain-containing protein n=1 Tax=Hymenobacter sp. GOD-10R TaxID=3093922 RepID=UPI002D792CF3|nr:DUF3500 domain-containing protein [Hymenobacter sp. GOD-10R]WRQ31168.1 DUF3500 domain-containing protein [Hymenobacter sp. GOD-10R]
MRIASCFIITAVLASMLTFTGCQDDDTTSTPSSAVVTALSCSSATFSTTAVSGAAYSGTASVPYTGGNGSTYTAASAISSTGVTGLSATLQAGILASGEGSLAFVLTGTPSGTGTATFPLSFGGQSCSFALTVNSTGSTTDCSSATGLARIVCLAETFKATLTATQLATVQLGYSKTDAVKWSNLPQALTQNKRVGINFGSLSTTQLAAAKALLTAVLAQGTTNEGYDEMEGNLAADDYLAANGGGTTYGAGNYYMAFLGTPSTTGLWELQFGGHHYTFANTYNGGKITGVTPSFRAVEPMAAITVNGRTYQPVEQERQAFAAILAGLSTTEQTTAKLSSTFTDILLGPGVDGQFPTTKQGLKVGNMSTAEKALVLNAIKLYTSDLDSETAATVLATYTADLDNTYVAYSGTLTMTQQNDYVRIDGPHVWIEYSTQGGIVVRGTPHPHSVWRDRTGDYGGN